MTNRFMRMTFLRRNALLVISTHICSVPNTVKFDFLYSVHRNTSSRNRISTEIRLTIAFHGGPWSGWGQGGARGARGSGALRSPCRRIIDLIMKRQKHLCCAVSCWFLPYLSLIADNEKGLARWAEINKRVLKRTTVMRARKPTVNLAALGSEERRIC